MGIIFSNIQQSNRFLEEISRRCHSWLSVFFLWLHFWCSCSYPHQPYLGKLPSKPKSKVELILKVTKTQQCLQYEEGKLRKKPENMFQVLRRLYNMEGLTGLYRGYSAGLLGTIHGGVQFYILEWLKRLYVLEGQKQTHFQMLFFPALSKVIGKPKSND